MWFVPEKVSPIGTRAPCRSTWPQDTKHLIEHFIINFLGRPRGCQRLARGRTRAGLVAKRAGAAVTKFCKHRSMSACIEVASLRLDVGNAMSRNRDAQGGDGVTGGRSTERVAYAPHFARTRAPGSKRLAGRIRRVEGRLGRGRRPAVQVRP
jgi:hypothetical protein